MLGVLRPSDRSLIVAHRPNPRRRAPGVGSSGELELVGAEIRPAADPAIGRNRPLTHGIAAAFSVSPEFRDCEDANVWSLSARMKVSTVTRTVMASQR